MAFNRDSSPGSPYQQQDHLQRHPSSWRISCQIESEQAPGLPGNFLYFNMCFSCGKSTGGGMGNLRLNLRLPLITHAAKFIRSPCPFELWSGIFHAQFCFSGEKQTFPCRFVAWTPMPWPFWLRASFDQVWGFPVALDTYRWEWLKRWHPPMWIAMRIPTLHVVIVVQSLSIYELQHARLPYLSLCPGVCSNFHVH